MKSIEIAPYLINNKKEWRPGDLKDPQKVQRILKSGKIIEQYKDETNKSIEYPLYHYLSGIYLIVDNAIIFEVIYNEFSTFNVDMVEMISVYRNKTFSGSILKLATHVFWHHLIEQTGIVITSDTQFVSGMEFWKRRINEALNHTSYFVYQINLKDINKSFVPITKETWLHDQETLWKRDRNSSNRLALISKTNLD